MTNPKHATFNMIGFFSVNKEQPDMLSSNGIMMAEVMKFVIENFNQRSGMELVGFTIYDSCSPDEVDILTEAVLTLELSKPANYYYNNNCPCVSKDEYFDRILGIVGPSISSKCAHVNKILSYKRLPMVSYGSTSPELYPDLYRTILPDEFQAKFLKDFLVAHKWTYISILYSDDTYGRSGAHALSKMKSLCVYMQQRVIFPIDDNFIKQTFNRLTESKDSNVIILWGHFNLIQSILMKASRFGVKGKTWVLSEVSGRNVWLLSPRKSIRRECFSGSPKRGTF